MAHRALISKNTCLQIVTIDKTALITQFNRNQPAGLLRIRHSDWLSNSLFNRENPLVTTMFQFRIIEKNLRFAKFCFCFFNIKFFPPTCWFNHH